MNFTFFNQMHEVKIIYISSPHKQYLNKFNFVDNIWKSIRFFNVTTSNFFIGLSKYLSERK